MEYPVYNKLGTVKLASYNCKILYPEVVKSLFKNPLPFISAKVYFTLPPELSDNCFTVNPAVTKSFKAYPLIETVVGTTRLSIVAGPTRLNAIPLI